MSKRVYVGNLPPSTTADEVRDLFSRFGVVEWVNLVTDVSTRRSRGFGFVGMASGADDAIRALRHRRLGGRSLQVRRALPPCREEVAGVRRPRRGRVGYRSIGRRPTSAMRRRV